MSSSIHSSMAVSSDTRVTRGYRRMIAESPPPAEGLSRGRRPHHAGEEPCRAPEIQLAARDQGAEPVQVLELVDVEDRRQDMRPDAQPPRPLTRCSEDRVGAPWHPREEGRPPGLHPDQVVSSVGGWAKDE